MYFLIYTLPTIGFSCGITCCGKSVLSANFSINLGNAFVIGSVLGVATEVSLPTAGAFTSKSYLPNSSANCLYKSGSKPGLN